MNQSEAAEIITGNSRQLMEPYSVQIPVSQDSPFDVSPYLKPEVNGLTPLSENTLKLNNIVSKGRRPSNKIDPKQFQQYFGNMIKGNGDNKPQNFSRFRSSDNNNPAGIHPEIPMLPKLSKNNSSKLGSGEVIAQKALKQTVLMRQVTDTKFSQLNKWNNLKDKLRSIDLFGQKVNFTYKYEESFKTGEGAALTALIIIAMITVAGIYFQNMINRTEQIQFTKTEYLDLSQDNDPFIFPGNPKQAVDGFQFAFAFSDLFGNIIDFEDVQQYLNVTLQYNQVYNINGSNMMVARDMKWQKCEKNFFATEREYKQAPLEKYYCLSPNESFAIQGNFYSDKMKYVNLQIIKCKNNTDSNVTCASNEELKQFLLKTRTNIIMTNSMFNSTDLEKPILSAVSDQMYQTFLPSLQKTLMIYIQRSQAELKDSLVSTSKQTLNFYNVQTINEIFQAQLDSDNMLLNVFFRKDNKYLIHERRVQNIYDWLAYIGGFWKAIFFIGQFIMTFMGYHIFVSSIMKRLYYFEKEKPHLDNDNDVVKVGAQEQEGDLQDLEYQNDIHRDSKQRIINSSIIQSFIKRLGQQEDQNSKSYNIKDTIIFTFCVCFRRMLKARSSRHQNFIASTKKLKEEMDVVNFIRNSRYLKALMNILLTRRESQILLRLRQIDLNHKSEQPYYDKFLNFKKSGVDKVSQDYVQQFFTLAEIQKLIIDVQSGKASNLEIKLLDFLGLEDDVLKLQEDEEEYLTQQDVEGDHMKYQERDLHQTINEVSSSSSDDSFQGNQSHQHQNTESKLFEPPNEEHKDREESKIDTFMVKTDTSKVHHEEGHHPQQLQDNLSDGETQPYIRFSQNKRRLQKKQWVIEERNDQSSDNDGGDGDWQVKKKADTQVANYEKAVKSNVFPQAKQDVIKKVKIINFTEQNVDDNTQDLNSLESHINSNHFN